MSELEQALAHHQAGRLKEAEDIYRQILSSQPSHADALHLLGVVALEAGDAERAAGLIENAVAIEPNVANYHHNLGETYSTLERLEKAAAAYRRAIEIDPRHAKACNSLGIVRQAQGRLADALAAFRNAVAIDPTSPEAQCNLGNTLCGSGALEEAIAAYRTALALVPGHPDILHSLGSVLARRGQHTDAVALFEEALARRPEFAEAHNSLANALRQQGDLVRALEHLKRAVALKPDFAEAYNNLGLVVQQSDQPAQAISAYQRALALDPGYLDAIGNLAAIYERMNQAEDARATIAQGLAQYPDDHLLNLLAAKCERREGRTETAIARLTGFAGAETESSVAAQVNYELGKLHDRAGDNVRAFGYFTEGNQRMARLARERGIDRSVMLHEADSVSAFLAACDASFWTPAADAEVEAAPVFFIGFPRSGTTLLEQILDSHPKLQTLDERPAMESLVEAIRKWPRGYPQVLTNLSAEELQQLREAYFQFVDRFLQRSAGTLLIDKFPLNTVRVPLIHRIFPNARFIFAVRHPCDVCLSCFMECFNLNASMVNFLTLADATAFYVKVMGLWQQCVQALPLVHHIVRYEDLVDDFEGQMRRLLEFLGVDWDDAVHRYAEHAQQRDAINTPSYHEVTEPIYRRARYRWRRYADELAPYMERLEPFIRYFGYTG